MRFAIALAVAFLAVAAAATDPPPDAVLLDPFAQATGGYRGCPDAPPPLVTPERLRIIAHERAERGTYCALEGRCEPGGAYKRDPEINERVRAAIAAERRFANASLWVTTSRRFVTVSGCVHSSAQRRVLAAFIGRVPGVDRVFDETRIGTGTPRAPAGR